MDLIDKQRGNLDFSYGELDQWISTLTTDCETTIDRCKRKMISLLEEEFTDIDSVATKITNKYISMPPSKQKLLDDFSISLENKELRESLKIELTQSQTAFEDTDTSKYNL